MNKIAIFVDVQNVYYTTKEAYGRQFDYRKFWQTLYQQGDIVLANAYAIVDMVAAMGMGTAAPLEIVAGLRCLQKLTRHLTVIPEASQACSRKLQLMFQTRMYNCKALHPNFTY